MKIVQYLVYRQIFMFGLEIASFSTNCCKINIYHIIFISHIRILLDMLRRNNKTRKHSSGMDIELRFIAPLGLVIKLVTCLNFTVIYYLIKILVLNILRSIWKDKSSSNLTTVLSQYVADIY